MATFGKWCNYHPSNPTTFLVEMKRKAPEEGHADKFHPYTTFKSVLFHSYLWNYLYLRMFLFASILPQMVEIS